MSDPTNDTTSVQAESETTERETADGPPVACSLDATDRVQREQWLNETITPALRRLDRTSDGFTAVFDRTEEVYQALSSLTWNESRCCRWATFELAVPAGDGSIRWRAYTTDESGVALFHETISDWLSETDRS
jgi:hypothetical protein